MTTKKLLEGLYKAGVTGVVIEWRAGGDDGSVENIEFLPADRKLSAAPYQNQLYDLGWEVYVTNYGGYTAGEFSANGTCEIVLHPDGTYTADSENNYWEDGDDKYIEDKDGDYVENPDYEEPDGESESHSNFILPEIHS